MNEKYTQVGRLAMRVEGNNWVAYYAEKETMLGAVFLGSIKMALIESKPKRRKVFLRLMRDCVADILEDLIGVRPSYPKGEEPAPESERSGNA